eukprot:g1082.t1
MFFFLFASTLVFTLKRVESTCINEYLQGNRQLDNVAITFLEEKFGELLPPFQFPEEWTVLSEMDEEELKKVSLTPALVDQILTTIFLAPGSDLTKALPFIPGMPQLKDVALAFLQEEFGELLPPSQFSEEWTTLSEMDEEELKKLSLTSALVEQILFNIFRLPVAKSRSAGVSPTDIAPVVDGFLYIHLPQSKKRKSKLLSAWKDHWQYISKTVPHEIQSFYTPTNQAIGCTLGHIRALQHVLNQNWSTALIIEDDVHPHGIEKLNLGDLPQHWYVLRLAGAERENCDSITHQKGTLMWSNTCLASGTIAYIIRKNFIPILLHYWMKTVTLLPPNFRPFESRAPDSIHYILQSKYKEKWLYVQHQNGAEFVTHGMFSSVTNKKFDILDEWQDFGIPYGYTRFLSGYWDHERVCRRKHHKLGYAFEELCRGVVSNFEKQLQQAYAYVELREYDKAHAIYSILHNLEMKGNQLEMVQ